MKLQDTIELMNSEDFKDRAKAEYYQLKIRHEGLARMLERYKEGTLDFVPNCSYELLHTQSLDYVADDIAETLINWERNND